LPLALTQRQDPWNTHSHTHNNPLAVTHGRVLSFGLQMKLLPGLLHPLVCWIISHHLCKSVCVWGEGVHQSVSVCVCDPTGKCRP